MDDFWVRIQTRMRGWSRISRSEEIVMEIAVEETIKLLRSKGVKINILMETSDAQR